MYVTTAKAEIVVQFGKIGKKQEAGIGPGNSIRARALNVFCDFFGQYELGFLQVQVALVPKMDRLMV